MTDRHPYHWLKTEAVPNAMLAHIQFDGSPNVQRVMLPLNEFATFADDPGAFPLVAKPAGAHRLTLPRARDATDAEIEREAAHYVEVAAALNRTADALRVYARTRLTADAA